MAAENHLTSKAKNSLGLIQRKSFKHFTMAPREPFINHYAFLNLSGISKADSRPMCSKYDLVSSCLIMHKLMASKPKKRLKRTNFTASALQIHKSLDLPDLKPDAPLQTSIDWPSWSQQSHPEIAKDIDGISTKKSMPKHAQREISTRSLDKSIHRWISLRSNTRWRRLDIHRVAR